MTPCAHTIVENDPHGLRCVLTLGHMNGHLYQSSAVPDGHDASEAEAEAKR